jgi:4-amino-4-deoxy-L-arabinose transferase-like glycosyltransferase
MSIIQIQNTNKLPIIITAIFFFSMFYIAFVHHTVWNQDGIYYYLNGQEFFDGNSDNIQLVNSPMGTPIIYAILGDLSGFPFETAKSLSLISGTAVVLFSYFITKNIFGVKIAVITQIIVAVNPKLHYLSISGLNELMPIALVISSFYFLTKNELKNSDFIFMGILLGLSFMLRYQAILVILGIVIFLFIRNKKIRYNALKSGTIVLVFLITASPMLIFNYITYETPMENDTSYLLTQLFQFQNQEWRESMIEMRDEGLISLILEDPYLFSQNYFYNLFSHNPGKLFNFGALDNLSLLPPIPILGFITVVLGFFYTVKISKGKTIWITLAVFGLTALSIFFISGILSEPNSDSSFDYISPLAKSSGIANQYYIALMFIPLLVLGILSLNKIQKNLLPLFIVSIVLFFSMSVIPVYRSYHFMILLIPLSILNSIFIYEVLPKFVNRLKNLQKERN